MSNKSCPECGSTMEVRLGMAECPSCGHNEDSLATPISKSSGPGFQQQDSTYKPPSPGMPGSILGGMGSHGSDSPGSGGVTDSLETEKNLFIGINIALYALAAFSILLSTLSMGSEAWIAFFGVILGAGVNILILLFVLKSDQSWAKYCCMGCTGLRLAGILFTLFAPNPALGATPLPFGLDVILNAITIMFDLWFFTILYRDVTQNQY